MNRVIQKFTRRVPKWQPRVSPLNLDEATEAQLKALKTTPSNTKVSNYVLTLAHDVESLSVRSPLFNAIMYDEGGMSRAERELGAIAASMVNRCIYCAAVHSDRHAKLEDSTVVTDRLFANGADAKLDPHNSAVFDFARKLSGAPPEASAEGLMALREIDLADDEILDLVLSVSLFGWANRLMHVLGEPVRPEEKTKAE